MAEHKKALSEAASFFVWSLSALGLLGASSPLFATATTAASGGYREELLGQRPAGCECRPRHEADAGCRNPSGPAHRNRCVLAALNTRHLLRKPVCGLKAPLGLSCPPGTAVLSGSLLGVKREHLQSGSALKEGSSAFLCRRIRFFADLQIPSKALYYL